MTRPIPPSIWPAVLTMLLVSSVAAQQGAAPPTEPSANILRTRGTGAHEGAAVEAALVEALRQALGVTTEDELMTRKWHLMRGQLEGALWHPKEGGVVVEQEAGTALRERIRASTKGVIESYRVLERGREGVLVWVEVEARVARFDRRKLRDGPFTLVVLPARAVAGFLSRSIDGRLEHQDLDLKPAAAAMTAEIRRQLVQSRKVDVLERDDAEQIEAELARLRAGKSPAVEMMRLRQQLGADYLLQVAIERASVAVRATDLQGLGFSRRQGIEVVVGYKLVETASGVIAAQDSLRIAQPMETEGRAVTAVEVDAFRILHGALGELQQQIVDGLLDHLAPLKVAATALDEGRETWRVWLNQGGGRFVAGDLFDVWSQGEEVRDPDSGELLDRIETRIATVRITEVGDRVAVGEVVGGDGSKVCRGAVVRRHR